MRPNDDDAGRHPGHCLIRRPLDVGTFCDHLAYLQITARDRRTGQPYGAAVFTAKIPTKKSIPKIIGELIDRILTDAKLLIGLRAALKNEAGEEGLWPDSSRIREVPVGA